MKMIKRWGNRIIITMSEDELHSLRWETGGEKEIRLNPDINLEDKQDEVTELLANMEKKRIPQAVGTGPSFERIMELFERKGSDPGAGEEMARRLWEFEKLVEQNGFTLGFHHGFRKGILVVLRVLGLENTLADPLERRRSE